MRRQVILLGQVGEACHLGLKLQFYSAGWPMTLFSNDDFRLTMRWVYLFLPI